MTSTRRPFRSHGVAETWELRAAGMTRRQLADSLATGAIRRIRRGWYAAPTADPDLVAAVRIGGRLACVSAAAFYGWATPERHGLHVCVDPHATRLRLPDTGTATLHWSGPGDDARFVTSRRETIVQIAQCQHPDDAVAIFDSFLQREAPLSADLEEWLSALPNHILRSLAARSELCESFLESIGRIRLERMGITGEHQVQIEGVGRVDLVIDGWLVIEWDGLAHHDSGPAHENDCRRDALLTAAGYRVLRFSYELVLHEWYLVGAAIRAVLDDVSLRPR